MKRNKIIFFLALSFLLPITAFAKGSASIGFRGNDTVYIGNTIKVDVVVNSVSGTSNNSGIASFGGFISYDSSCLEMVKFDSNYFQRNGNKIAYASPTLVGFKSNTTIATITFKGLKTCSSNVTIKDIELTDELPGSDGYINPTISSKTIKVTEAPSGNTNLSSLSVNEGNLNFQKNTTNYTVSVESNVTSITINALAEDSGAKVIGTGTKSLNYGNNNFSITVTAPSGSKKTYSVNVIRKDNRSSNTKLSSLSVSDGTLSPNFSSDIEQYSISVPYAVSSLNIRAVAADSKSKVTIQNNNLAAESTTEVRVVVTSENGSTRTYTIAATRGKDPNKVLSTNNNLQSLSVSQGMLSPVFNKNQLNYIVYLPYEIDKLELSTQVEDTTYAKVQIEGSEQLSVGNNQYKIKVTAEDESVKVYSVTVVRGQSLTDQSLSSNIYLKEIKIENGYLKGELVKDQFVYQYKKGNHIEVIPEDENSIVEIYEHDDVVTILVKAQNGEIGVYTLLLASSSISYILFIIIILLLMIVIGYLLYKDKKQKDSSIKKDKKSKKEK